MKKNKNLVFGWLMVLLFSVSAVVVYAAEALTAEKFEEKMKDMGYETMAYGDMAYAYPEGSSTLEMEEMYIFQVFESEEEAKETIEEAYEETDDYDKLSRSKVTSGNKTCITVSGEEDGEYAYLTACSIDDTVVMGLTSDEGKVDTVKSTMKELGYYGGSSILTFVIIGVVVAVVVVVVLFFLSKKKGNNMNNGMGQPMMNNNMNPGMPQPMNTGMAQPMTPPMDNGMNFGQPQPVNPGMAQPMTPPMDNGMNFGQPQPANPGMAQPMNQPMNNNNNLNQPNNMF